MKLELIAQLAFAGAMVGFLIGPDSLDQFFGVFPQHGMVATTIAGGVIGALLGAVASLIDKPQVDES